MGDGGSASSPREPRTESALRESERRFRAAFENAGTGMCLTAPDGAFLEVNRALCDMLGYSEGELKSLSVAAVTHPDDLAVGRECVRCLTAGEEDVYRFQTRYLRDDGGVVRADVSTSLFRDAQGQPLYFITQTQEVTDDDETARCQQENELRASLERYRGLFGAVGGGIVVLDADGNLTEANAPVYEFLGLRREQALGSPPLPEGWRVLREDGSEFPAALRPAAVALRTGRSIRNVVTGFQDPGSGAIRWTLSNAEPVFGPHGGEVKAVAVTFVDITELKRSEAAIRGNEERYRTFIDATDDLVFAKDDELRYLIVNRAQAEFFGRAEDEIIGRTDLELMPDDIAAAWEQSDRAALRSDRPVVAEEVLGDHHYEFRKFRIDLGEGRIGVGGYTRDISERRRAKAALRVSSERFRTAFEEAPIGVSLTAVDGVLLRVNRAFCDMLAYSEDELVGRHTSALTHPDDAEAARQWFETPPAAGHCKARAQIRYQHHDGHIVWGDMNTSLLRDAEGRPLHFITHIVDITDRKRAEAALQESERRFREMTDLLPDMVFELDTDLRVTYINRAVTEVLGYTQADLEAGLSVADVVDAATLPRARERLRAEVLAGRPAIGVYDIRHKDGSTLPMEVHSSGVVRRDGGLVGYRGVMRDITDRRKAEDAQRFAALGQLAAGVAHEFNNLLASLMLQAELTSADPTAERRDELVRTALAVATRGGDASRNLTIFARPELARREPLHVEAVIDAGLALTAHQIENAEVVVTRDYGTNGQRVYAHAGRLEQVFINLFVNACHAMPEGGKLTIATRHVPQAGGAGEVVVTVTDTGTGIKREHLPRIFEPFFTTKGRLGDSDIPGCGLGLSVSRGIVKAHGGEITARSEVGAGTTLELVLPAHVAADAAPTPDEPGEAVPSARAAGDTARILVAEDAEGLSSLIEGLLTADGHEVKCVYTAQEAIRALRANRYDLVITDLVMPGGGGREVLASARSGEQPPPVLVITGLMEAQVEEEALAMGAGGVLHKPFAGPDLTRAVGNLLAASDD